tara:strand:+ start:1121 stop:1762 length:642 start_codon:yes stop_codon:yes gene_type:complete
MHPLYPFLQELLFITTRNYLDNSNVGWVGVMGGTFLPDSESEEEEEYALYPDSDDDHDDCYCIECERKIDIYEPPITRLQKRNQETLINRNNKLIECLTEEINCLFNYMEEQKHYTKEELEQKLKECFPLYVYDFWNSIDYVTEQNYRDQCETINIIFEAHTSLRKDANGISFIQLLMRKNQINRWIDVCKESYTTSMEKIIHLRKITRMIQK